MHSLKKALLLTLLLALCRVGPVFSGDIVAVKSHNIQPYSEALEGFKSACGVDVTELVISETGVADVMREIRDRRPSLVFAVGRDALSLVKEIEDLPIIYTMVLNPRSLIGDAQNITGVNVRIAPVAHLGKLRETLPWARRIGLVYDPRRTGSQMKDIRFAASYLGIELVSREVTHARDVPSAIKNLRGKIDVYWMLPDATVVSPLTIEFLLLFSFENKIPIVTFSEKFVKKGALMSLNINKFDIGRQAGEMAKRILAGADVRDVPRSEVGRAMFSVNMKTARKMGISLGKEQIKTARTENGILQIMEKL